MRLQPLQRETKPNIAVLQLVINEVLNSSPQALQAVRLLAQYAGNKVEKVTLCCMVLLGSAICQEVFTLPLFAGTGSFHPSRVVR